MRQEDIVAAASAGHLPAALAGEVAALLQGMQMQPDVQGVGTLQQHMRQVFGSPGVRGLRVIKYIPL